LMVSASAIASSCKIVGKSEFDEIVRDCYLTKSTFYAIPIAVDFARWRTAFLTTIVARLGTRVRRQTCPAFFTKTIGYSDRAPTLMTVHRYSVAIFMSILPLEGGMGGWVDEWMGGWVDEWMSGWVDGWTRILLPSPLKPKT
jgi:hypothetical protein